MDIKKEQRGDVIILHVAGRLDFGNAKAFQASMESLFESAIDIASAIVIDCAALEYISSAGLRVFLICARLASKSGLGLAVCNLTPLVKDVFDISGFDNIMAICGNQDAALSAVSVK